MDFLKILTGYRRDENSIQFLVNTNVIVSVCGVPAKTVFATYLPSFPPDTLRLGRHPSCQRLLIMDMVEELGETCEDEWRVESWYQRKKERVARYNTQYRQDNKEVIAQYYQENKAEIAQYYQDNKEEIAQYKAQYYQDNKAELRVRSFVDNKLTCIRELCDGVEKAELIQKRKEIHRKRKQLFDSGMGEAEAKDELLDDVMNLQKEVKAFWKQQETNQ